jgi:hypothetical protein
MTIPVLRDLAAAVRTRRTMLVGPGHQFSIDQSV